MLWYEIHLAGDTTLPLREKALAPRAALSAILMLPKRVPAIAVSVPRFEAYWIGTANTPELVAAVSVNTPPVIVPLKFSRWTSVACVVPTPPLDKTSAPSLIVVLPVYVFEMPPLYVSEPDKAFVTD